LASIALAAPFGWLIGKIPGAGSLVVVIVVGAVARLLAIRRRR
jgi:hypothetical protein